MSQHDLIHSSACLLRSISIKPLKRVGDAAGFYNNGPSNPVERASLGPPGKDRPRSSPPKYLLALAPTPSSLSLLHAMSAGLHRQAQNQRGRAGPSYALLAAWIDFCQIRPGPAGRTHWHLEPVRLAFPNVTILDAVNPADVLTETDLGGSAQTQRLLESRAKGSISDVRGPDNVDSTSRMGMTQILEAMLESPKTATGKADTLRHILLATLQRTAQAHDCAAILLGDSATGLAARVISDVAKGRGADVGAVLGDRKTGMSIIKERDSDQASHTDEGANNGDTPLLFPNRDSLRSELALYYSEAQMEANGHGQADFMADGSGTSQISLASLQPAPITDQNDVSSRIRNMRDLSIDELLQNYFDPAMEEKYPGVVSNVVRTVEKLDASLLDDALESSGQMFGQENEGAEMPMKRVVRCTFCGDRVAAEQDQGLDQDGRQNGSACKRCIREFSLEDS